LYILRFYKNKAQLCSDFAKFLPSENLTVQGRPAGSDA